MRRILLLTAVAGSTVVAAAACSTLGKAAFKQPVVTLQDVRVTGVGFNGGSLDVVLNIQNPNNFNLDASQLDYSVLVDTLPFANGTTSQHFSVGAKRTQPVHIPINFTYSGAGAAARSLMNTGSVNYTVRGHVTVASPIGGDISIPYSQTGRFSTLGGVSR